MIAHELSEKLAELRGFIDFLATNLKYCKDNEYIRTRTPILNEVIERITELRTMAWAMSLDEEEADD